MDDVGSSTAISRSMEVIALPSWLRLCHDERGLFAREHRKDQNWTILWCSLNFGDHAMEGRPHLCSALSIWLVRTVSNSFNSVVSVFVKVPSGRSSNC